MPYLADCVCYLGDVEKAKDSTRRSSLSRGRIGARIDARVIDTSVRALSSGT